MMQFEKMDVLVTGGASGMGYAVAKQFKDAGSRVMILDCQPAVFEVAEQLGVYPLLADVTSEASIDTAFIALEAQFSNLSVCVNCAGIAPAKKILSKKGVMPLADFERVIAINLIGTFNVMRKAVESMSQNTPMNADGERGVIINTASIAAFEGQIGQAAYAASKGGVVSMTLPAARELASLGIRVNTIAPGLVETPMLLNMPEEVQASLAAQVPFPHRFARPDEYAKLVMHIVENSMINGEVIRFDGALRMSAI